MTEEKAQKPKKDLDHLFFGESISGGKFLSLKCNRENCWLDGRTVKEWREGHIDFEEVQKAVTNHTWEHIGRTFAKMMEAFREASKKPIESLDESMEGM